MKKLLEKQKQGKKRMRRISNVDIPRGFRGAPVHGEVNSSSSFRLYIYFYA